MRYASMCRLVGRASVSVSRLRRVWRHRPALVAVLAVAMVAGACSSNEPELASTVEVTEDDTEPAEGDQPPDAEQPTASLATPTPLPTPTPAPTATPVPTPTPTPEPDCLATAAVPRLVAMVLMPLATPAELPEALRLAEEGSIGALALLGAPSAADMDLVATTVDATTPPLLVASDEEGGRVQRLAALLGPLPTAAQLATMTPLSVRELFADYGTDLRSVGVSMALAPVVDVGGGPGIGDRAFGADPDAVTTGALAVIEGYQAGGVIPVVKHFPGHGAASQDTHDGVATTPPIDELRTRDLEPFAALADATGVAVMVGHLLVPGLTEDLPTSLSPAAIDGLLRTELGFDGLVLTDALGMGAIAQRWSQPEAALLALQAGADMVILGDPAVVEPTTEVLLEAVASGTLPRERLETSVRRALDLRGIDHCALVDAPA